MGDNGAISITGYNKDVPSGINGSNQISGSANGDIFWIRAEGYNTESNFHLIHIYNKKPMKFYLNKVNEQKRIVKGNLKIKIEGPYKPGTIGSTVFEKTYDLSSEYEAKGLKIEIPKDWKSGRYILTEVEAPAGYKITNKRYHIDIDTYCRTVTLAKIDTGERTPEEIKNQSLFSEIYDSKNVSTTETIGVIDIKNERKEYPLTGGIGSAIFYISDIVLMAIGISHRFRRLKN